MDETIYWLSSVPDNNGSGGSVSIGGGGGGNSSSSGSGESSASASGIFNNDAFSEDSWKMTDYLLEDILGDCMGEFI